MQQRCIPTKNRINSMIFICYAALLHTHMVLLHLNFKIHYIMTKKKKSESQTTDRKQKCGRVTQISDTLWSKSKRLRRR